MGEYWHKYYICPYYRTTYKRTIVCEDRKLEYKDKESIKNQLNTYCASWEWGRCPIAQELSQKWS